MSLAALNPTWVKKQVQAYRNKMLVGKSICKYEPREFLVSGDTINFGLTPDVRSQSYTAGVNLEIDAVSATSDFLHISRTEAVTFSLDLTQVAQSAVKNLEAVTSKQAAHRLSANVDQVVLESGTSEAEGSLYGGVVTTLSNSTTHKAFADANAELHYQAAGSGRKFAVVDPATASLLSQELAASGNAVADSTLRNGFKGTIDGFDVYVSNNLKSTMDLTVKTNPTAGDTMTVLGQTWYFVANGTAASAGEISIGGSAAATQAIVVDALNGTGTPGASTYIALTTMKRRVYQAASIACGSFVADVAIITGYGRLGGSETFTDGGDGFGVESNSLLFGLYGAIALAMQVTPQMKKDGINAQIADEYKIWQLFGTGVFERNAAQLVVLNNRVAATTI